MTCRFDVIQAVYTPHSQASSPEPDAIDRRRLETLPPGISSGHEKVTAGTSGAFVYDRKSSHRGVLSNRHVLAFSNDARPGDPIVQPGPNMVGADERV